MKNAINIALALLITGCVPNRRLLFKQTGSSSTKGKPSPIISSFLELVQKKTVDAAKICGGAENAEIETQQISKNGLLGLLL